MAPHGRSSKDAAKDTAQEQREAKNKTVVESTFHNIVDYYTDPQALSTALIEAKKKSKNLEQESKYLKQRITYRDSCLKTIESQIKNFLCYAIEEEEQNLGVKEATSGKSKLLGEQQTMETIAFIKAFVNTPHGFRRTEQRLPELAVEIEKSKMFIKILEGVQGVSAVGGIKRPRDDAVKEESDNKKPRII